MGKLALAAKITHVPSMYLSELPGARQGSRQDAIDGHAEIGRRCRELGVDTIVVFDRVRENFRLVRADPGEVLNRSINQTLSRTVITSFVAFLTVLALYLYGGGSLQGMAEAQMIGIIIGTLSSIFVACPLLLWLGVSKQDLMPKARDEEALARRP